MTGRSDLESVGPGEHLSSVLVVRPPQVLSYFNAGHHLALYQVAGYLKRLGRFARVDTVDASVERVTWKDIASLIHRGRYAYVAVMNDLDGVDGIPRFLHYLRSISPASRALTFGRLSALRPHALTRFDFDAVVGPGDFETGVAAALAMLEIEGGSLDQVGGLLLRTETGWRESIGSIRYLEPDEWVLPEVGTVPYGAYMQLYADDGRKFSGLPSLRELVVPVARGCPIGCSFCEVPRAFGIRERRLSVTRTISYIEESFETGQFDYISFYAPTFTLNKTWVRELCTTLGESGTVRPWKCCTTIHHLDQALVEAMGAAGCLRISVGLETLDQADDLPKLKRKTLADLEALAAWCAASGIELNCFVVVGLPGTSIEGAQETISTAKQLGARVRPTAYTPYERLDATSSDTEFISLNRQTFIPYADLADRQLAYSLLHES